MGGMSAHTSFRQGQPVFVQLKSGEQFTDKFQERRSTHIVLRKRGKIAMTDLRAVSIARKTNG